MYLFVQCGVIWGYIPEGIHWLINLCTLKIFSCICFDLKGPPTLLWKIVGIGMMKNSPKELLRIAKVYTVES